MELVVEKTSSNELMDEAERLGRMVASTMGALLPVLGELDRREAWRTEGATSLAAWLTQRLGVAEGTGRSWSQVAGKLWDMPHLAQGLRVGALSFDKARVAAELATPESDASVLRQAEECTVRQLIELVRANRGTNDEQAEARHDNRYLRFNDARRLITAQLSEDAFAEVRAAITQRARLFPSDGETRYDQRRADALLDICRGGRRRGGEDAGDGDAGEAAGTAGTGGGRRCARWRGGSGRQWRGRCGGAWGCGMAFQLLCRGTHRSVVLARELWRSGNRAAGAPESRGDPSNQLRRHRDAGSRRCLRPHHVRGAVQAVCLGRATS